MKIYVDGDNAKELCQCTDSFAQLFALERKQIALKADEKLPLCDKLLRNGEDYGRKIYI